MQLQAIKNIYINIGIQLLNERYSINYFSILHTAVLLIVNPFEHIGNTQKYMQFHRNYTINAQYLASRIYTVTYDKSTNKTQQQIQYRKKKKPYTKRRPTKGSTSYTQINIQIFARLFDDSFFVVVVVGSVHIPRACPRNECRSVVSTCSRGLECVCPLAAPLNRIYIYIYI